MLLIANRVKVRCIEVHDYCRLDAGQNQSHLGYTLPDENSSAYDEALDYTDVQLKIIQNEGYEAHDFNIFDDRAALLWRKPYGDGAVRELTSGEDRSPEELRRAVENLMISAGDRNPDVRATIHAGHTDQSNIRVRADIGQTDELLKRIRRDLVSPSCRN